MGSHPLCISYMAHFSNSCSAPPACGTLTGLDGLQAEVLDQDSIGEAGSIRPAAPKPQRNRPQRQHRATSRVASGCEEAAPQITLACVRRALTEHRAAEAKMQVGKDIKTSRSKVTEGIASRCAMCSEMKARAVNGDFILTNATRR